MSPRRSSDVEQPEQPEPEQPEQPGRAKGDEEPAAGRPRGPLESLFQEALRRATAAGLSGFFFTEEAVRRAFTESVPAEWSSFLAQQRAEVRDEMIERVVREFGGWLRSLDTETLLREALAQYDFHIEIDVRTRAKDGADPASLHVVPRRK